MTSFQFGLIATIMMSSWASPALAIDDETQAAGNSVVNEPPAMPESPVVSTPVLIQQPRADAGATTAPPPGKSEPSTERTAGWISLWIGSAGVAVGAVTASLMVSKRSELDSSGDCTGARCTAAQHDQLNSYNSLRPICTAGFIIGAVGVSAGVTLLLTAPKHSEPSIAAWVGPASAGVEGKF